MHGVVVDALAEAVTVTDAAGSIVYANEAAVRLLRADSVEELLARRAGRDHGRASPSTTRTGAAAARSRTSRGARLRRGRARRRRRCWCATSSGRRARSAGCCTRCSALRDADGAILRDVVNVIEDVTERQARRARPAAARATPARRSRRRWTRATRCRSCVEAIVPGFARVRRRRRARARPHRRRIALAVRRRRDAVAPRRREVAEVLRDGTSQLRPEVGHVRGLRVDDPRAAARRRRADRRAHARQLRSAPALPRGRPRARRGARPPRRRGGAQRPHRTRGATAIARALQHGLLPPELPEVPGWPAAVSYLPAGELNEVGGDFYDIFRGSGGLDAGGRRRRRPGRRGGRADLARPLHAARRRPSSPATRRAPSRSSTTTLREQPRPARCARWSARASRSSPAATRGSAWPAPAIRRRCWCAGRRSTAVGRAGHDRGRVRRRRRVAGDRDRDPAPGDLLVLYTDGVLDAVGPRRPLRRRAPARRRSRRSPGPSTSAWPLLTARLEAFRDGRSAGTTSPC